MGYRSQVFTATAGMTTWSRPSDMVVHDITVNGKAAAWLDLAGVITFSSPTFVGGERIAVLGADAPGLPFTPANAPTEFDVPYDFYDDFTVGTQVVFSTGSSRTPKVGANTWLVSGGVAANARVGGPSGFVSTAGGAGNIYATMSLNSGAVPGEVGGTFVYNSTPTTVPTIAILQDPTGASLANMLHCNMSVSPLSFGPSWWTGGSSTIITNAMQQFGINDTRPTLVVGQQYTRRIFLDQLPFVFETFEDSSGNILGTHRFYEPNAASIVGPCVFFETNAPDLSWLQVWARPKPATGISASHGRFRAGIDATPIGKNAAATGRFTALHSGTGAPQGRLSVRHLSPTDAPVILGSNTSALLEVRGEGAGTQANYKATNGGGGYTTWGITGGYVVSFQFNGTEFLGKSFNGDVYLASGIALRFGGAAGPRELSGSGTPEGAVTAPIGSTFRRTDGGAATSFYVKESGTGNTGWIGK